jgi:ABC-2 type transport system permease protein
MAASMTHWTAVFIYEIRQQFRRKAYLLLTFGVPLLAIAGFFGYQAYQDLKEGGDDKPVSSLNDELENNSSVIGYVDLSEEHIFPAPAQYPRVDCTETPETPNAAWVMQVTSPYCMQGSFHYYETRDAGLDALKDGDLDVLYVIEPDYVNTGNVSLYMTGFNIEGASTDQLMEDYLLSSMLQRADPETYERLYLRLRDAALFTENRVSDSGASQADDENQNYMMIYGFGIILLLSIMWGGGYLMQSVVQEKESRIIEILLSSARPTALLLGKILAMGTLSLLQLAMFIGTFLFLASKASDRFDALKGMDLPLESLPLMLVYFLLGFLFFGALMAAVGAMSTTVRESQNFVVVVTLPAAIPFFFLTMFVEEPNGSFATTMSFIPFTASLSMVMRMSVTDIPFYQHALSLGVMIVGVTIAIWLAGRLFRVNTLLMGNMPRLKDIPKLLRG